MQIMQILIGTFAYLIEYFYTNADSYNSIW